VECKGVLLDIKTLEEFMLREPKIVHKRAQKITGVIFGK
jgi:hypothetical protein